MEAVLSAHQPNFLPYLGFFDKMANSDIFVIRDEVQFVERDWQHRNKIRTQGYDRDQNPNWKWVTVPVKKEQKDIKDIEIKPNSKVKNVPALTYIARQIEANYSNAPYFKEYFPEIKNILSQEHAKLSELNMQLIYFLQDAFGIDTEIVKASELPGYDKVFESTGDLVNICKAAGANIYLSGDGGRNYLDFSRFENKDIQLMFQNFEHPVYPQRFDGFAPYMASIDALFNVVSLPQ